MAPSEGSNTVSWPVRAPRRPRCRTCRVYATQTDAQAISMRRRRTTELRAARQELCRAAPFDRQVGRRTARDRAMKIFQCQACDQPVTFEATGCESCARQLGYVCAVHEVSALEPQGLSAHPAMGGAQIFHAYADPGRRYRHCNNAISEACNWLVPEDSPDIHCTACRHNRVVPDLSQPGTSPAGAKSRRPSTGCSTRCCAWSCRSRPAPSTRTGWPSTSWPTRPRAFPTGRRCSPGTSTA